MMEKIDLVYILGSGSCWNNNEIRYSLRSIEKHFLNAGKVFVIGELPEWATNITHIQVKDDYDNKLLNARLKYKTAAKDARISKDFILMNDDFFFIRPTFKIENYSRGTLSEMINLHPTKNGYYYHSLWDTRDRLDRMGIPREKSIDFEIHAPIIFNKEKLLSVMGMIGKDKAYSIRSCYGNLMNLEPKITTDYKAANITEFAMQKIRTDAHFLSINDALVADEDFRRWINDMFPKKSKYELNDNGLQIKPGRPISQRKYYARKEFRINSNKLMHKGDLIEKTEVDKMKCNPAMADLWEWK